MKTIPLTQHKSALVDDEDYEWLNQWKWCARLKPSGQCYAVRVKQVNGTKRLIRMHRLILGAKQNQQVDHIDHNGLNNTRKNIRLCTASENQWNRRKLKSATSKYKGVRLDDGRWRAQISHNGQTKQLGSFSTEEEAAKAYNEIAKQRGKFAKLNDV